MAARPTSCSSRSSRRALRGLDRRRGRRLLGRTAPRHGEAGHARRHSLLLTLAGYWIGRYGETTGRDRAHAPYLSVGVVTILYALGSLIVHFMLGDPAPAGSCSSTRCPGRRLNLLLTRRSTRSYAGCCRARASRATRSSSLASRPSPIRPGALPAADPGVAEPYRLTPQIGFRIAVLGVVALAVFAVLFFRLWALQVLSGDKYLVAAQNNQMRVVRSERRAGRSATAGPRARHQRAPAAVAGLARRPAEAGRVRRAAPPTKILDVPVAEIAKEIKRPRRPADAGDRQRGVHENRSTTSRAPVGVPGRDVANTLRPELPVPAPRGAVLGYVGEISPDQLEGEQGLRRPATRSASPASRPPTTRTCAARRASTQLRVDSLGRPISADRAAQRRPQAGDAVRLTIDAELQRAAEQALVNGISLAQANGHW